MKMIISKRLTIRRLCIDMYSAKYVETTYKHTIFLKFRVDYIFKVPRQ